MKPIGSIGGACDFPGGGGREGRGQKKGQGGASIKARPVEGSRFGVSCYGRGHTSGF